MYRITDDIYFLEKTTDAESGDNLIGCFTERARNDVIADENYVSLHRTIKNQA